MESEDDESMKNEDIVSLFIIYILIVFVVSSWVSTNILGARILWYPAFIIGLAGFFKILGRDG